MHKKTNIIPRDLSFKKVKEYLFPDLTSIDPKLSNIFYSQAGTSLFLVMATTTFLSILIFVISLFPNIETITLTRSILVLLFFQAVIMLIHKIFKSHRKDFYLLLITVILIVTWGVLKDVVNFGITFNSYGILYITTVFFALIFMPFRPKFSLLISFYSIILYILLSILFIYQIFGHQWFVNLGDKSNSLWLISHLDYIAGKDNLPRHPGFLIGWHLIQYFIFGAIAFVFRAANLQSFIKAFISQKEQKHAKIYKMLLTPENQHLEFKSSVRWDFREGKTNKSLEKVIAKTIAGFMNAEGGILLIGVNDDGGVIGLQNDYNSLHRKDSDGFEQYLIGLISNYIGAEFCRNIDIVFLEKDELEFCCLEVESSAKPVFVEKLDQAFFVRTGNSTQKFNTKEALEFIESKF